MPPRMAPTLQIIAMMRRLLRRRSASRCFEEGRIHVLRAVRDEVHHRHQQRRDRGTASSARRCARPRLRPVVVLASSPRLRIPSRSSRTKSASSAGRPPMKNIGRQPQCGNTKKYAQRREQIARARSLPAAGPTARRAMSRRHFLHRERRADAPFAAHADAEQRAQDQERRVVGREAGEHFDDREEDQVDHQRQPAAVAVGQQAEDERADRAERQRDGDRPARCRDASCRNSLAMAVRTKTTRKKSNASSVQPRKLAMSA